MPVQILSSIFVEPLLITVPLLTLRAYRRESFIKHEEQQRSAQQPGVDGL
jgi:hypothetical protein